MNTDNLFEQMANISKAHAFDIVSKQAQELKEENDRLKAMERGFYMSICRAYNAGKQNMSDCLESKDNFVSSHDYFVKEFPTYDNPTKPVDLGKSFEKLKEDMKQEENENDDLKGVL